MFSDLGNHSITVLLMMSNLLDGVSGTHEHSS